HEPLVGPGAHRPEAEQRMDAFGHGLGIRVPHQASPSRPSPSVSILPRGGRILPGFSSSGPGFPHAPSPRLRAGGARAPRPARPPPPRRARPPPPPARPAPAGAAPIRSGSHEASGYGHDPCPRSRGHR